MPDDASAIALDALDLAVATALVLVAGIVSVALRVGIERSLALASVRTVVQLLLVGHLLSWVFAVETPWLVLGLVAVMTAAAGHAAIARVSRVFPGATLGAFATLVVVGCATTFTVTSAVIGVTPWYEARYVVPLLGMVLGNSLTGIALCLDDILETFDERRPAIELELALGATRWEAARDAVAAAIRRGMIPTLNAMAVVGIVSLPGMMTGQILEGGDPVAAVEYQIVVMFMLAASTSLGCTLVALLAYFRLFNERHQLREGLIAKRRR